MSVHKGSAPIENVADLQKYLSIVHYPASKKDIYTVVKKQGTNINVITLVQVLPEMEFHTPREVLKSIGLANEYGKI